ncbi:hypothetical protein J2789_005761 [Variovorax paradoxus]|uniref:hypothetical protein n=1 Tax=Variovorax atrisoli TaxID=3394203 RepID=UPI00119C1C98|nr:hypothetical protein [Variovorax paradoxus]MDR6523071.1 hypothetical protein [Variovorax paradoxus]
MINRSTQNWAVGATVKVGFLSLTVIAVVPTPGDFKPDAYVLASKTAFYEFVPHHGISRISADEARLRISEGERVAAQQATATIAKASAMSSHVALASALMVSA